MSFSLLNILLPWFAESAKPERSLQGLRKRSERPDTVQEKPLSVMDASGLARNRVRQIDCVRAEDVSFVHRQTKMAPFAASFVLPGSWGQETGSQSSKEPTAAGSARRSGDSLDTTVASSSDCTAQYPGEGDCNPSNI